METTWGSATRRAGAIVSLVFIVAGLVAGEAAASFPGGNGKIAFVADPTDDSRFERDVFTVEPDGSDRRNLTADVPGLAYTPTWSADGRRLAFFLETSGTDWYEPWSRATPRWSLITMAADGSDKRTLLTFRGGIPDVTWAPDGTRLAFTRLVRSRVHIFVVNSDGTGVRSITPRRDVDADEVSWSPDGREIAFTADLSGGWIYSPGLYVMNADGTGVRRLARPEVSSPDWSPDGQWIAFESVHAVHAIRRDGSGRRSLLPRVRFGADWDPVWSPDTTKVLVVSSRWEDAERASVQYAGVANADGSCPTRLVPGAYSPSWQPDPGRPPSAPLSCADLAAGVRVARSSPERNAPFRVTVTVTNRGNQPASGVAVAIQLVQPRGPSAADAHESHCTSGLVVRCSIGTLAPGSTHRSTVRLSSRRAGYFRVVVETELAGSDPDPSSDTAEDDILVCTQTGTADADVLVGTPRRDILCGLAGADRIEAGGGNDIVYAGLGNDVVSTGSGTNGVDGSDGNDLVLGGPGADLVTAGRGNDVIRASGGRDEVSGDAGNDLLAGDDGSDQLAGDGGRDTLLGGPGRDSLDAYDGRRDFIDGGPGPDEASVDRLDRFVSARRAAFSSGFSGFPSHRLR